MPLSVKYREHVLIVGPGLDEVVEADMKIVVFDEHFMDVYGDYVFLGYDVAAETIVVDRADLVGLYTAAALLDTGSSVIVCGKEPKRCLMAIAAHMVYRDGVDPENAITKASSLLKPLYGTAPQPTAQGLTALKGLYVALDAIGGAQKLSIVMSLALNYEYGEGKLHYGETVSWLVEIGAEPETIVAGLLHFMLEGHGPAWELYERRLEALGRENIINLLGQRGVGALSILEDIAYNRLEGSARTIAFIEALGPGKPYVHHIRRRGEELIVYCRRGTYGEPDRDCVAGIEKASKLLPVTGITRLRVAAGEPVS